MNNFHAESVCREIQSKYLELESLLDEVVLLKYEVAKLKNHPINDYPDAIRLTYFDYCRCKKMQHHILCDVYEFLEDFKRTRNTKLKKIIIEVKLIADELLKYDSIK